MELLNKKALIVGMAKSGISSAILCHKLGAQVVIYDNKNQQKLEESLLALKDYPFEYVLGDFDDQLLDCVDFMVLSPGVPTDLSFIIEARHKGLLILGEIELAYRFCQSEIIAITGTNGKTTTTSLVGEIMKAYNPRTFVVGNIGHPFTDVVLDTRKEDQVVAEISSFQLETIHDFKPKVSAILNLTEDHLNRHKTFENYIQTKLRITENQGPEAFCILNYDDPLCRALAEKITAQVIWFSMCEPVVGIYYKDGEVFANFIGINEKVIAMKDVFIFGKHNIENIMAAVAIALCVAVPLQIIRKSVSAFRGVEHRIEFVREVLGVRYYNDSKATNPDSAIAAIRAMATPTILIGGGMDKGNVFNEWIEAFDHKVKALILLGETKQFIYDTAKKCGFEQVMLVNDLEEAVQKAVEIAVSGDSVLLSPACASWDMFKSYEERGQLFKNLVTQL